MMNKTLLVSLICSATLLQAHPFKKPTMALQNVKLQKSSVLSSCAVRKQAQKASMRPSRHNYVANHILSSSVEPSVFLEFKKDAPTNFQQRLHVYEYYAQTLDAFQKERPQLGAWMYYQSIPNERHIISSSEKSSLLRRILPLYRDLRILNNWVQDEPLEQAVTYMENVLQTLHPSLVHELQYVKPQTKEGLTQQEIRTFCLYPSEAVARADGMKSLEGKNIMLLNDDSSLLDAFETWYDWGVLLPQTNLKTQSSASQFLLWMVSASQKPDIIFTDIQLGDATGYYVAYQLRKQGYTGGIIALTSYAEDAATVQLLKTQGFDGLVSLQSSATMPLAQRITQAAQVYLERRHPHKNK